MNRRATPPAGEGTPVFAWITGERTNVGDSLLRRPYLAALRRVGPVDLWINRSTPDFLRGLDPAPEDTLTPRFARWYPRLLRTALRRRTILVLNAGEFRVHPSRVGLLLALVAAALVVRLRRGATVWIGVSVPPSGGRLMRSPVRWAGRHLDDVRWRDTESPRSTVSRPVVPDWAFAEGTPVGSWSSSERRLAAFVLRGDRSDPTQAWFDWARTLCADHGLRPVVVIQVRQDAARAAAVAAELGGDVIDWPAASAHDEQERAVREVYRRSLFVIGDRLHGLIIGATEGAIPLGWVESSRGKIRRHFEAVGLTSAGLLEGVPATDLPRIHPPAEQEMARDLRRSVSGARSSLARVGEELERLRDGRGVTTRGADAVSAERGPAPL